MVYLVAFLISLFASLVAIIVTLIIESQKSPKMEIKISSTAHDDKHIQSKGRWKFFRVEVVNKPFCFNWMSKFLHRETAEGCRAKIEFYKKGDETLLFSFIGRWASTPEISNPNEYESFYKIQNPDPVIISVGNSEKLDIFVKPDGDTCAYGWSNASYLGWKNTNHKLDVGEYLVKITVSSQNAKSVTTKCLIAIRKTIEETILKEIR